MPSCSAYGCTNRSGRKSKKQIKLEGVQKIGFHAFPKNPEQRKQWIKAVRRQRWSPTSHSTLCSLHFDEACIDRTSLAVVRLRENAVPTLFDAFPSYLKKVTRKSPFVWNQIDDIPSTQGGGYIKEVVPINAILKEANQMNNCDPSTSDEVASTTRANRVFKRNSGPPCITDEHTRLMSVDIQPSKPRHGYEHIHRSISSDIALKQNKESPDTGPHEPCGASEDNRVLNKPEHEQLNCVDETVSIDSNRFENVEDSGCMAADPLFGVEPETSTSVNPPKDVTSCLDTSQSAVVSSMSVCRVCLQDSEGQDMVPLASDIIDNDCSITIMDMINAVSCIEAKNNDCLPTEVCLQCLKLIVSAYQLKLLCESSNVTLRKMLEKINLQNEEQKITEEKMEETKVEETEIKETSEESIISSNNQSRNIFCQDCNVSMFKSEIRMHMATCKMKRRAVYFSRIQKMLVICQHCNFLCYNAEMREHRKICNKLKPAEHISKNVLADNMDDQSSDDWYFQNLRQSEENVKLHYCSYCKESYDRRDVLRAHLAKVHPLSRERLCMICGKIVSNHMWRLHQNKHAQFRPHTCDLCNKKFYTAQMLRIHLRTHTREKPYQCPQCPKRFNLKNSLKYHFRTHTGERPYACIICDKRFTISTNMRTHMKVHELINNEDEKTESAAEVKTSKQRQKKGKSREIKKKKDNDTLF